ncbi:type VI secretion system baseplate subunit TssF [Roseospira marina]|uniref:Type VI secretion system baseplate subunit TssF n=1 Tax=Roseospira marina TaxID=140057 RepID=A0A5M6I8S3_9PROT|nr:type VI secretion system baseplate subunit TssF [Roseospira marina]KAA5604542.1 type VI secretion system baseplate subunit TssF [Roseospira marina]MBB4315286.1 type VI secretion system protein ImpG [Roseospira marina]MBB5088285.1 type VI secretion system protein ImpG [Roseospira marina]
MVDDLLPHYQSELTAIRRLAGAFAAANPKIAGRLRLSETVAEDPHVARLIESFAFLTGRIRLKLDDTFPELTDALLGVLYPHFLAPIPSMAVVGMTCQADLSGGYTVARGTEIDTSPAHGEPCRFRTGYDTTLWPVRLQAAALASRPFQAPNNPRAGSAVACLRLTFQCLQPEQTFSALGVDRLRLFLRGAPHESFPLYELLLNNTVSVALADTPEDRAPVILPPDVVRPVGFAEDEGLLPWSARSAPGYRLLSEFFAFPEKFLFVDLAGLDAKVMLNAGNTLEVFVYLDRTFGDLERTVSAGSFALGCTPVVNLIRQRAEPIDVTQAMSDYRVIPDSRRPKGLEVYRVERVTATSPDDDTVEVRPFYGVSHGLGDPDDGRPWYWMTDRRPGVTDDTGTEVYLGLVDLDFERANRDGWVLSVETLCINRDLPNRLPFGGGNPKMALNQASAAVIGVTALTAPTRTLRPGGGPGGRWQLVSHLALNHLSLAGGDEAVHALREILALYDVRGTAETRALVESVVGMSTTQGVARTHARVGAAMARGLDVALELDERATPATGTFLFASVLDHFLGLYCSINSFTRLSVSVRGRPGVLRRFAPRSGTRVML